MEGRAGRLINSATNRLSNVGTRLANGLADVVEEISTREFTIKEGLPMIFYVFAGFLGIATVVGAINNEIDLAAGGAITAAVSGALGTIIKRA